MSHNPICSSAELWFSRPEMCWFPVSPWWSCWSGRLSKKMKYRYWSALMTSLASVGSLVCNAIGYATPQRLLTTLSQWFFIAAEVWVWYFSELFYALLTQLPPHHSCNYWWDQTQRQIGLLILNQVAKAAHPSLFMALLHERSVLKSEWLFNSWMLLCCLPLCVPDAVIANSFD